MINYYVDLLNWYLIIEASFSIYFHIYLLLAIIKNKFYNQETHGISYNFIIVYKKLYIIILCFADIILSSYLKC